MTKCIFCDVEGEFYRGAAIGKKGRGICGECMEWLVYYIKRQDFIEKEDEVARRRGISIGSKL